VIRCVPGRGGDRVECLAPTALTRRKVVGAIRGIAGAVFDDYRARNSVNLGQSDFSRPSRRAISASSESRSAKGSSTLGDGLPFGAAFVLSTGGRASADFRAQSDAGADGTVFGAGRAWAKPALAVGTLVTVGAAGGSAFAIGAMGSAFEPATAGSAFSARRGGAGATGDGAKELPGLLAGAVSVARTGAPRLGEALAGMIGGGMVARGCAGRGGSA
jgi:hypothetical protein